ncbi:MAG TPA: Imm26 family immunity protein [Pyrinomonadaceae bacterium]|nr:Imm26 family immunity protein [Pyrinomonadaceae bacterium]
MFKGTYGDIFAFRLPNQKYISGRIQLNVARQCVRPKLLSPDSPLRFFGKSILVEIYEGLSDAPSLVRSETLIPGVFVDTQLLESGEWKVVDHEPVDPTKIEFPEALMGAGRNGVFTRGEIKLPLPLDANDLERLNVYSTIESSYLMPNICLHYLGMEDVIDPEYRDTSDLRHSDLRFSEYRKQIYGLLNEDENQSYYGMSSRLGHDVTRFYK